MRANVKIFSQTAKICIGALLIAIGLILPQFFHMIGGSAAGGMMLPMHIPVLLGGLLLGSGFGGAVGALTPVLSFALTGMPPAAKLPFMLLELVTYGLVAGWLASKKKNVYVCLISAQICGRLVNALALAAAFYIFRLQVPAVVTVWSALLTGIPGIVIQLILIPALVFALQKGMNVYGRH